MKGAWRAIDKLANGRRHVEREDEKEEQEQSNGDLEKQLIVEARDQRQRFQETKSKNKRKVDDQQRHHTKSRRYDEQQRWQEDKAGELGEQIDDEHVKRLEKRLPKAPNSSDSFQKYKRDSRLKGASVGKEVGTRQESDLNLSFCGCGFLGIYHVGVASCFREYAPQLSRHKISGSSAGALVAMAHICGNFQLVSSTTDFLAVAIEARSHTLGPFHPSFDVQASVRGALERGMPEDAWRKATGRLHVSLTRVEDGANVIINEFESNEDLIQVLLCSAFIPFWSGMSLPKYKGVAYIDGGFSNNLLILDDKTITVSPFAGEADICPSDETLSAIQVSLCNTSFAISPSNLYRLSHALLPPRPEILSDLCEQGFADGIRYLQKRNLISCTKCLEFRFSFLLSTSDGELEEVLQIEHGETSSETNFGSVAENYRSCASETASLHQFILEQQEQRMQFGLVESGRSASFMSTSTTTTTTSTTTTTNQYDHQRQRQQARPIGPSISLRNLLTGNSDSGAHGGAGSGDDDDRLGEEAEFVHCNECRLMRKKASDDPLPKQFSDRIRDACDKVNKSLSSWIYSHRPVKYLSYLMVPYYLPIDLTIAMVFNCWKKMPWIRSEMIDLMWCALDALIILLRRIQTRSTTSMLLDASWQSDVYEQRALFKQQLSDEKSEVHQRAEVHHHHHHHHHHHRSNISLVHFDA